MLRKLLLSLLVVGSLFSAACSAEGGVSDGEDGDGVEIKGDIDEKEE
jgi:hypothetical protein